MKNFARAFCITAAAAAAMSCSSGSSVEPGDSLLIAKSKSPNCRVLEARYTGNLSHSDREIGLDDVIELNFARGRLSGKFGGKSDPEIMFFATNLRCVDGALTAEMTDTRGNTGRFALRAIGPRTVELKFVDVHQYDPKLLNLLGYYPSRITVTVTE